MAVEAMDRQVIYDEVNRAVNRVMSPWFLYTLVALVLALLLSTIHVWNTAVTNQAWAMQLNGKVAKLEAQTALAEQLEQQNAILLRIADAVGVQNGDDDGISSLQGRD